ncbi:MAG: dihydroorotase [Lachnospiraceae bacterium]|nr:dihydroorotase [Lachnospiraceae bacterium]
MRLLIKGGYLLDPKKDKEGFFDVFVVDKRIYLVSENIDPNEVKAEKVINAEGLYVMPGFIDLHVHFRVPGEEYKEDLVTGSKSAARGGYTTVCTMPNTNPALDTAKKVSSYIEQIKKEAVINVLPVGAITIGRKGDELVNMDEMMEAGAVAFSEDGCSVKNSKIYLEALQIASALNVPIFAHCEDLDLVNGGCVHDGEAAKKFGLKGIIREAEDVITARDILLAKRTKARLHLCHVSTKGSVKLLEDAKKEGYSISGETGPHYYSLTDADITENHGRFKMNPPLRTNTDKEAIIRALSDNVLEAIATDHAPHSAEEKNTTIDKAKFGIVGLETAFSVSFTELVNKGRISPLELVRRLTSGPAQILGMDNEIGTLSPGTVADITLANPDVVYEINPEEFESKCKISPFAGKQVTGKVVTTIVGGNVVFKDSSVKITDLQA